MTQHMALARRMAVAAIGTAIVGQLALTAPQALAAQSYTNGADNAYVAPLSAEYTSALSASGESTNPQHPARHKHMMGLLQTAATVLNMEPSALWSELEKGRSLSEVAVSRGMSEGDFVRRVTELQSKHIDQAVTAGNLSKVEADKIKSDLPRRIERIARVKGWGARRHATAAHHFFQQVASILHMDQKRLVDELKAGKSIAEVSQAKGVAPAELEKQILNQVRADLARRQRQGEMTAAEVERTMQGLPQRVHRWVEYKGWFRRAGDKPVQGPHSPNSGNSGERIVHPVDSNGSAMAR